ncbi:MAG: hypothetical protein AVO38_08165 [delta proteobacterium ML8_D]|nr:MAG: hypothetical protein AVO38_08165 [delta proteobacterium ML8_D]
MNRKKIFAVLGMFAILFGIAQSAGASIPNHFMTTDGDSDVLNWNINGQGLTDGWYFGIYDFGGSPASGLNLLFGSGPIFQSAEFSVTQPGGTNWQITVLSGGFPGGTLNIGDSEEFSFYFWDGSSYITDLIDIAHGGGDAYSFASAGGNIQGDDLNAVPLTSSAILLFSGFAGLMAFGNRRKIRK